MKQKAVLSYLKHNSRSQQWHTSIFSDQTHQNSWENPRQINQRVGYMREGINNENHQPVHQVIYNRIQIWAQPFGRRYIAAKLLCIRRFVWLYCYFTSILAPVRQATWNGWSLTNQMNRNYRFTKRIRQCKWKTCSQSAILKINIVSTLSRRKQALCLTNTNRVRRRKIRHPPWSFITNFLTSWANREPFYIPFTSNRRKSQLFPKPYRRRR